MIAERMKGIIPPARNIFLSDARNPSSEVIITEAMVRRIRTPAIMVALACSKSLSFSTISGYSDIPDTLASC